MADMKIAAPTLTPQAPAAAAPAKATEAVRPAVSEPKSPAELSGDRFTPSTDEPAAEHSYRSILAGLNSGPAVHASLAPEGAEEGPVQEPGGPNDFEFQVSGQYPPVATGNVFQQNAAAAQTHRLGALATVSQASSGTLPGDDDVQDLLESLGETPPFGLQPGSKGENTTYTDYQSNIPNSDPKTVYQSFVNNPNAVFGEGGVKIRPETAALVNDGRYMLEIPGSLDGSQPPTWLPIQVTLDDNNNQVGITTLDGHVLRGYQTFTFEDNGQGGTTVNQEAAFELNSNVSAVEDAAIRATGGAGVTKGQHDLWEKSHRYLWDRNVNSYFPPQDT